MWPLKRKEKENSLNFNIFFFFLLLLTAIQKSKDKKEKEEEKLEKKKNGLTKPIVYALNLVADLNKRMIASGSQIYKSTLITAMLRLSFALYVVNYTFIRYDFFSSRVHNEFVPNAIHLLAKRLSYTFTLSIVVAYIFQMFIFGPFDSLRKRFTTSAITKGVK